MNILHSDWLVRMIEKSANTPQARMLNFFDILDDWLNAPKIDNEMGDAPNQPNAVLQHYLTLEAAKAGAGMPEMLANQLYFMAIAAANEKVHGNTASFEHAKLAAKALIAAQTKRDFVISKKTAYATAAGLTAISILTGSLLFYHYSGLQNQTTVAAIKPTRAPSFTVATTASPDQTAALFAKIEQMRKGNCQLIEAIQLPDAYKKVYFQNVVLGQISTDPQEQKLANQLLDMVRCNYTPMLMANSKD
jgi:hypothetical protein